MSSKTAEWLIVVLFFMCFFGYTAGETFWLNRKYAVAAGKAFAFSFSSNLFCITVGFFVSMMIFFVILALAWDGYENAGVGETTLWTTVIIALIFPLALLFLAKFLLLKLFRFSSVEGHLKYAALASVVFMSVVLLLPGLAVYVLFR